MKIKYVGATRLKFPFGTVNDGDEVEVADDLAAELVASGMFKKVKIKKVKSEIEKGEG